MGDKDGFLERCSEIKKTAFSFDEPLIVHHYDADGVSSGSIVAGAFQKENKKFRRECIKKLDDSAIDRYMGEKEIIFVDLGGGNKRVNELKDLVVIDHHQTDGIDKPQANPILHGLDGGSELSAAGTAYCVFRHAADLAIVGAMGDMQFPLTGMNRWVLEEGVKSGEVKVEEDLKFYGRYCRPLVQFLAFSDDPYIPGISYREDRSKQLLSELGIDFEGRRVYADLSVEEKRKLISALTKVLVSANRVKSAESLVGESYVFPKRPHDETYEANEFSTLLNACGRHGKPDIGVRVCLGDKSASEEARALLQHHRKMLREGISYASDNIQDFGLFYFLDGRGKVDEGLIGVVCGMALHQSWKKPVLGVALGEDETVKFSGRAPRSLVNQGMNLGQLMKEASEKSGGIGGGHMVAAGASVPKEKLNEFLRAAGDYLRSWKPT